MLARIFQPPRSAMTSGRANASVWILEYVGRGKQSIDPVTGTVHSTDMQDQVELQFDTLEQAVAYAKKNDIPHRVYPAKTAKRIPRSYADNFATDRRLPWTH